MCALRMPVLMLAPIHMTAYLHTKDNLSQLWCMPPSAADFKSVHNHRELRQGD